MSCPIPDVKGECDIPAYRALWPGNKACGKGVCYVRTYVPAVRDLIAKHGSSITPEALAELAPALKKAMQEAIAKKRLVS